ncbi:sigma-70 family RNA polymerase sigma factor [bacterium]|nr:sigma-70 family RNA polymerase sigma factor [bacterium]
MTELESGAPPLAADKDERALLVLARGDESERERALQGLHALYKDEVFAFSKKLVRDPALAEDVLQESFLSLYASFDRYDPERPFRPWLFQIVRNAAFGALRARRKNEKLAAGAEAKEPSREGVLPGVSALEMIERTQAALDRLPEETRALLLQRHGLGMNLAQVAESFSVTERTVRNRLRTAADQFARALFSKVPEEGEAP